VTIQPTASSSIASTALQALRAVIDAGSRTTMRSLSPGLFFPEEQSAYDFLSGFYQRHGSLPSVDIMRQNGFNLPTATGPLDYWIDRLRDRAVYSAAAACMTDLDTAITARNVEGVRQIVRDLYRAMSEFDGRRDTVPLADAMATVLEEALLLRMNGAGELTGVPFGWYTMNRATAGGQPGDVISVVARPNVGKSWTILFMALTAWLAGHPVVLVTMEMTDHQMARRMLALASGMNPDDIRRGRITMHGEEILHEWVERARNLPPFHLMSGSFKKTTADIDRLVQEFGPDGLYIDASYLVGSQKKQRNNGARWEKIYDVGEEIKGIAQDRNLPVIQSLQLSREKKEGVAFDMNQIAGGDVIGQISSVVVAVDYVDDPTFRRTKRKYTGGKNRDGELFDFDTNFLFNPMDFSELPREDEHEQLMARLTGNI